MDADTLIEADGLQRMVRPFLYATDVVATGGTIRVVNGSQVKHGRVAKTAVPTHMLAGMQVVEYLRAFLFGRLGWLRCGTPSYPDDLETLEEETRPPAGAPGGER